MKLFSFLQTLLTEGRVTVEGQLSAFEEDDISDSEKLLEQYYEEDILQMPAIAPLFSTVAGIWAAQHIYLLLQLIVLRDTDEETIHKTLTRYPEPITAEAICSADLVLRYLPDILSLAKGLAPADIMVTKIKETAVQWPFSSIGIALPKAEIDDTVIMNHPSLRIAYIDKIIHTKDLKRISGNAVTESVCEALGNYSSVLWPEFFESLPNNNSCTTTTKEI